MLWTEALVPALAPSAAILAAWAAASLWGVPLVLPTALLALFTLAAFGAAIALGVRRVRRLPPPPLARIDRRLEQASGLSHRPLLTLRDRPATVTASEHDAARNFRPDDPERAFRHDDPARALRHDDPERAVRHDDPARALRHDDPARAFRHDDPARALRHDDPARALRHDDPARAAPRDDPAPAARQDAARALWTVHQARTEAALGALRTGWPRPSLAPVDRWRLRFVLPVLLAGGALAAGRDAVPLLLAALLPGLAASPGPVGQVQAWITPPAFSGLPPVFLHAGVAPAPVPSGSVLSVNLTGGDDAPRLLLGPSSHARFHRLAAASWQAGAILQASASLRIRQGGHRLVSWDLVVEPVGAPVVAWSSPPGAWHGGWRTRLAWTVTDRYGVTALAAQLRPVRPAGAPAIVVAIPLEGAPTRRSGVEMSDLSASPFAGTDVDATLVARNTGGREGVSRTIRFTLPARPFHDPLARAVLDVRRRLALAPATGQDAAAGDLGALGDTPHAFDHRFGLYLNLESTAALLRLAPPGASDAAEARLWALALEIEDARRNGSADARDDVALRAAEDAVDRQVARMRTLGATGRSAPEQAELARRLDALRQALAARMKSLAQEALRHGLVMPPDPSQHGVAAGALDRMMRDAAEQARNGHMDEAARSLSRLEDMLDRMRPATADDVKRALQQMQATSQARGDTAAVADMVKREAGLLDRAQKREARATPPAPPQDSTTFLAIPPDRDFPGSPQGSSPQGSPSQGAAPDSAEAGGTDPNASPPPEGGNPADGAALADPPQPDVAQASPPAPASSAAPASSPAGDTAERSADRRVQRALGRAAGLLADQFGALTGQRPKGLGQAADDMKQAAQALAAGRDREATAHESQALRDLQSGGQQMANALQKSGGSGSTGADGGGALLPGFASSDDGGDAGDGTEDGTAQGSDRDPLGRKVDGQGTGTADDTELALPGDAANARSRALEEELRRRDSDRERPRDELDYLGRLLQPF